MNLSKEYIEEFGTVENYEGKILEVHHVDGDDDVNNFIDEHADSETDTVKIKVTYQEDDRLYGELLDGTDFPYHINLSDIGMGSWEIKEGV